MVSAKSGRRGAYEAVCLHRCDPADRPPQWRGLLVFNSAYKESLNALNDAESAVVINEAMSENKGIYFDDKGKSSDWVELYNPTDEAVSLSRFSLSDDEAKLDKWTFPDITLDPHGYVVVFLSGDSGKDKASLHASFKLKAKGETLILSAAGNVVDSVDLPARCPTTRPTAA